MTSTTVAPEIVDFPNLSMMGKLCNSCALCADFMNENVRKQHPKPELSWDLRLKEEPLETEVPLILVLDDVVSINSERHTSLEIATRMLGGRAFTYANTIRCTSWGFSAKETETALERCAVWTNQLTENRLVIISTKAGLKQLKVDRVVEEGDMFRSVRLGIVLCIPPLLSLNSKESRKIYTSKIQRVLKEADIL